MQTNELTTITFRLPTSLREEIKERAKAEERSEGAFIRFHLGRMFALEESEADEIDGEAVAAEGGAEKAAAEAAAKELKDGLQPERSVP